MLIEGRLVPGENGGPRIWTRPDGTAGASFEVTANTVRFLSSRQESGGGGGAEESYAAPMADEEIPF